MEAHELRRELRKAGVPDKAIDQVVEIVLPHITRPVSPLAFCKSLAMHLLWSDMDWGQKNRPGTKEARIYTAIHFALRTNLVPIKRDPLFGGALHDANHSADPS